MSVTSAALLTHAAAETFGTTHQTTRALIEPCNPIVTLKTEPGITTRRPLVLRQQLRRFASPKSILSSGARARQPAHPGQPRRSTYSASCGDRDICIGHSVRPCLDRATPGAAVCARHATVLPCGGTLRVRFHAIVCQGFRRRPRRAHHARPPPLHVRVEPPGPQRTGYCEEEPVGTAVKPHGCHSDDPNRFGGWPSAAKDAECVECRSMVYYEIECEMRVM